MSAYYNEWNPYAAQWLRNLISANLIASGDVDERDIKDVKSDDVRGYTQAHFFAGIGGWSYALRLAGWPDDRPVWSGSCPCQPFSCAGQRKGHADERHLWPSFYALISECKPATVFGEQVGSKDGREWLSAVRSDLEEIGYAVGGGRIPACAVGAPHQRQRFWFVADDLSPRPYGTNTIGGRFSRTPEMEEAGSSSNPRSGQHRSSDAGRKSRNETMERTIANSDGKRELQSQGTESEQRRWVIHGSKEQTPSDCYQTRREDGQLVERIREAEISLNRCAFLETWQNWNGGFSGFGRLDDGIPKGVAKCVVGGFGNAIVPQAAQVFIESFMEYRP